MSKAEHRFTWSTTVGDVHIMRKIHGGKRETVAVIDPEVDEAHPELRAIFAAAPELVDVLRDLLAWPALVCCVDTRVTRAREALARAEGRA